MSEYTKPKWLALLTDMVRPGGVALMFLIITILPIIFALLEIGLDGVGYKMATVLAKYFQAVPDIYYNTLQIMFGVYVAGKSGEVISTNIAKGKAQQTEILRANTVEIDQRGKNDGPNG